MAQQQLCDSCKPIAYTGFVSGEFVDTSQHCLHAHVMTFCNGRCSNAARKNTTTANNLTTLSSDFEQKCDNKCVKGRKSPIHTCPSLISRPRSRGDPFRIWVKNRLVKIYMFRALRQGRSQDELASFVLIQYRSVTDVRTEISVLTSECWLPALAQLAMLPRWQKISVS